MRRSVVPAHGGGQGLQEIGGRALDPIGNLNGGILRRRRCCVMCSAGTQASRDASLWQQSQLAREVHYWAAWTQINRFSVIKPQKLNVFMVLSGENAGASSCPESVAEQLFASAELTARLTVVNSG